jgi:ribosomal protein S18 acetylase RimI-like enzyme
VSHGDDRGRDPGAATPTTAVVRAGTGHVLLALQAVRDVHERACDPAALAEFLADPSRWMILAIEGERVVGSLNGHSLRHPHRREPQFLLYEIDVRAECRRRGVGRALVEAFLAGARRAGAFEVWVPTNASNAAATALYRRCGLTRQNPDDVLWSIRP